MGWLYIDSTAASNLPEWVQGNILGRDDEYEILASDETQTNAFYAAVRRASDNLVFALVLMLDRTPTRLGYKALTEDTGPEPTGCPAEILDLLSPLEELYPDDPAYTRNLPFEFAREWRADCRARRRPRPHIPA